MPPFKSEVIALKSCVAWYNSPQEIGHERLDCAEGGRSNEEVRSQQWQGDQSSSNTANISV